MLNPPIFTAREIATAIGIKRQSVAERLRGIEAAGMKVVSGNQETPAWALTQMPADLATRLANEARRQNCRSVEVLLAMPRKRWQPEIPLEKVSDTDKEAATKLREALRPWLVRQHDSALSSSELDAAGVADYRRIFGNAVTARYWRELFARTIERDGGFEEWNNLAIYLPDRVKGKDAPADVVSEALAEDFAELESYIAACSNPHDPNKTERCGIWTLALEKTSSLVMQGYSEKSAARRVRQWLFARASFLAESRDALLKAFDRKREALKSSGGDVKALRDGRAENGSPFELPDNDRDLLIHRAAFKYRGTVPPAWRELLSNKEFSPEVVARYTGKAKNKSHVPTSVMDSVRPEVELFAVMHRGPRAFDAAKGYVTRGYDDISSLQCISGDDFTLNTYFYIPDGKGWFDLTRGQVILFIDFRSLRILGWALEPHKSYSSLTIRSLCTHVFGEFGVPEVLYFERGIWESATLLKGKTDALGFTEVSQGLREFGITFQHAIRPRTKVVERIGGIFQNAADGEPGYCGRMEMKDGPEALTKQKADVLRKSNPVHPKENFYSYEQWNERIGKIAAQYNADPQQGHILAGLSPDQAFEKYMNKSNPPMQFSAGLRYLLANDKRLAQVTTNGVTIQVGKVKFNYRGKEIAHLIGREVLAWFDPENPEIITVTNPDRSNPICVSRSENPSALESLIAPESGVLSRELSRIGDQVSHLKTRYNVLKTKFPLPQRQLLADAQAVDLGRQIGEQKTELTEKSKHRQRQRGRAQKLTQSTGIVVPERAQDNLQPEDSRFLVDFLQNKEEK